VEGHPSAASLGAAAAQVVVIDRCKIARADVDLVYLLCTSIQRFERFWRV
jgi:hypothetical protein